MKNEGTEKEEKENATFSIISNDRLWELIEQELELKPGEQAAAVIWKKEGLKVYVGKYCDSSGK